MNTIKCSLWINLSLALHKGEGKIAEAWLKELTLAMENAGWFRRCVYEKYLKGHLTKKEPQEISCFFYHLKNDLKFLKEGKKGDRLTIRYPSIDKNVLLD